MLAVGFCSALISFSIQPVKAQNRTWTVDDDGPADFQTIQAAISAAAYGDIILVNSGIYLESIVVNTGVSLIGYQTPTVYGDANASVIKVTASGGVTIRGFNVTNGGYGSSYGDGLLGGGIEVFGSSWCTIADNTVFNNSACGISLVNSNYITVQNNTCLNNWVGIRLWSWSPQITSHNTINNNTCVQNSKSGIHLWSYVYSTWTVNSNNITNNICTQNLANLQGDGIYIGKSQSNLISGNTFTANYNGISLQSSWNCTFFNNSIIANTQNVYIYDDEGTSTNRWDKDYFYGGNYWSNYSGLDANGDGIGDTPYTINANNNDRYPLMTANRVLPTTVQTTTTVNAQPDPVGIGQLVTIFMSISPPPPTATDKFGGITLRIVHPDGKSETKGPFLSNTTGSTYVLYTPTLVGNYTLQMTYSGETFSSTNTTYHTSSSPVVSLKVQQEPVTSGSPPPTPSPNPTPTFYQPTPTPIWNPTPTPTATIRPTVAPALSPTPSPKYVPQPEDVQPTQKPAFPTLTLVAVVAAVAVVVVAGIFLWKFYSKGKL